MDFIYDYVGVATETLCADYALKEDPGGAVEKAGVVVRLVPFFTETDLEVKILFLQIFS